MTWDAEIDARGLLCPLPVLKARRRLRELPGGAVLRLVADDPAAVVDVCRAALGPLDASQHLLGNHHVTIDGDSARSECYVHAQHVRGALAPADKFVVAGTYRDTLARRDGAWKITSRRLQISWTDGNPDVLVMP